MHIKCKIAIMMDFIKFFNEFHLNCRFIKGFNYIFIILILENDNGLNYELQFIFVRVSDIGWYLDC